MIEYCPTNEMVADFFTKPLQGKKFQEFKDTIMGHDQHDPNWTEAVKSPQKSKKSRRQECVGGKLSGPKRVVPNSKLASRRACS